MEKESFTIIVMSRLSPIFPFPHLCYLFGVTNCSLYDYVVGTALGLIPGVVAYCYMGSKLNDMVDGEIDIGMVCSVVGTILSIIGISYMANGIINNINNEN